jgi:hypothetical protein
MVARGYFCCLRQKIESKICDSMVLQISYPTCRQELVIFHLSPWAMSSGTLSSFFKKIFYCCPVFVFVCVFGFTLFGLVFEIRSCPVA